MFERALRGNKGYWTWIFLLLGLAGIGTISYLYQFQMGLGITGMSRDVSWGLYIGQFTFLVGVAASAVMLVIPYYLHDFKKFGKIVILGEFLAISAVTMCILFIFVDMGQPMRIMNVILHPTPNSVMFWDSVVLSGYLAINLVVGWTTLHADKKGVAPPSWVKPYLPFGALGGQYPYGYGLSVCRSSRKAFLGLSAIMAARFLASAFAAGPALLIILALIVRKFTKFDPGKEAIQAIGKIVTYAMFANVFFLGLELFTAFYSNIPGHMESFRYLYIGHEGHGNMIGLMWTSAIFAVVSLFLLVFPQIRRNEGMLSFACIILFISLWIDKGFGLIVGGFVPNMFERFVEYWPTLPETLITIGVWAIGFLVLTLLYKVAVSVREEMGEPLH